MLERYAVEKKFRRHFLFVHAGKIVGSEVTENNSVPRRLGAATLEVSREEYEQALKNLAVQRLKEREK